MSDIHDWTTTANALDLSEMATETVSEQPTVHLRWVRQVRRHDDDPQTPILQQLWYVDTYRGPRFERVEEWRDVALVVE